jgi:hypothetical protein
VRIHLIRLFLETEGAFAPQSSAALLGEFEKPFQGILLPREVLEKIYYKNFEKLAGKQPRAASQGDHGGMPAAAVVCAGESQGQREFRGRSGFAAKNVQLFRGYRLKTCCVRWEKRHPMKTGCLLAYDMVKTLRFLKNSKFILGFRC